MHGSDITWRTVTLLTYLSVDLGNDTLECEWSGGSHYWECKQAGVLHYCKQSA
uniref:Uncharacterized protein n=1 Tax=Anguilla anguilla TaxID=7936 RepID=A0A0E9VBS6_ANGAN